MSWKIDPSHSEIQLSVRHMMVSKVRGHFATFSGEVDFNEENPAASSVDVTIDASSINTRDDQRDGHLKSPDFLNVEEFPTLRFVSNRVEVVNDHKGRIFGDLTIRDVSRPVVLDAEYTGQAKSPWGTTSAGFSATTSFDRKEWGLGWNQTLETGGILVGDKVNVSIELELIKQEG
ncbi:MAG: polyisoprenoid-binding protein [Caldilineaceae bacterium]|nr:polyisoprenoid-binding protein [Caldilineaceae bacterium]